MDFWTGGKTSIQDSAKIRWIDIIVKPTLAEVLSDPVTMAVMDADGVDRHDLAATLSKMVGELTSLPGAVDQEKRTIGSAKAKAITTDRKPDVSAELA